MRLTVHFLLLLLLLLNGNPSEAQKPETKRKQKNEKADKADKAHFAETEFSEGMKAYILGKTSEAQEHFEASEKMGGENAALNFMLAQIYVQRDKLDLGLQYAQRALKEDNKNKYYYLLIASIYEMKQNYAEAAKIYKKLITEVPKADEYYYELADIYYFQKNYEEALKAYDKIENLFGRSLPLTQRKQEIYLKQGNVQKAIEEGDALIQSNPDETEYKVSQADFYFKNKMTDKAIPLLEKILKDEPENTHASLLLSNIYQMEGNQEKSEKQLESVFNNPETDIHTKINIISGYLKSEDTEYNREKALKLSEAMVKTHPSESKAYAIYGEALRRSGKKEEALKNFVTAKNIDNSNFPVWMEILSLDTDLNRPDSLVKHSDEALETFPNQAVIWMYKGMGLSQKKNYKEAVEALEEGRKLSGENPDLKIQFNLHLGDNYYYVKDYPKSDAAYEEVLKLDGNNAHALNNYSYFLSLRKEKLDLARSLSEKLIKNNPDNASYADTYAWVLYQMKHYEEARKIFEKVAINTDNGTIAEHYGDVLFQLGQKDQAVEQWKKAKKLGETSDLIDKKISDKKLYE